MICNGAQGISFIGQAALAGAGQRFCEHQGLDKVYEGDASSIQSGLGEIRTHTHADIYMFVAPEI